MGQLCPTCVAERGRQDVVTADHVRAGGPGSATVTYTVLAACVAIFLATGLVRTPVGDVVYVLGAQFNDLVGEGQLWRLVTSGFLHSGLPHILFNMFALHVLGPHLERQFGSLPFAGLYFGSMLAGGAAFYLLGPSQVPAVGASGAIFGLFGAWFALALRHRHTTGGRAGLTQIGVLLAINLALPFFVPNIAWQAHLGGLIAGALVASAWTLPALRGREGRVRRASAGALVGAVALALVVLL